MTKVCDLTYQLTIIKPVDFKTFRKYFDKNMKIIFYSCNSGDNNKYTKSLGYKFNKQLGFKVYAPNHAFTEMIFEHNDKKDFFFKIWYFKKDSIFYNCFDE